MVKMVVHLRVIRMQARINNPKTTPNQPLIRLKITPNQPLKIENKKEKNKKDKINNKNNTNIEKETKAENESASSIISNNIISNNKLNNCYLDNSIDYSESTNTKAQSEPPVHPNIKDDGDFLSSIMLDDDDDDMTSNCGGSMDIDGYWEMRLRMGLGM